MARFGLRIRLFEPQSHFLSMGKHPGISNPTKIQQKSTGAGFAYRDTLWGNPITGSNGKSPDTRRRLIEGNDCQIDDVNSRLIELSHAQPVERATVDGQI